MDKHINRDRRRFLSAAAVAIGGTRGGTPHPGGAAFL